jgi:ubiquinone/menaquinone biosynthesis C-methylase UbiE
MEIITLDEIYYFSNKDVRLKEVIDDFIRGRLTNCINKASTLISDEKIEDESKNFLSKLIKRCEEHSENVKAKSTTLTINKLAEPRDLNQLARKAIVFKLLMIKNLLDNLKLPYSTHMQESWLRMWEYSGAIIYSQVESGTKVLDAGGTGTIFSYYLAIEGCETYTVDIDEQKVKDAIYTSQALKLQNIKHYVQDIRNLEFEDNFFDRVFSICVIEHIEPEHQAKAVKELARVLKPGGILCITFDYGNYYGQFDSRGTIKSPKDLYDRIIVPSGLEVIGNETLKTEVELEPFLPHESFFPYESIEYIFGSIFLKKPGEEQRKHISPNQLNFDFFPNLKLGGTITIKI